MAGEVMLGSALRGSELRAPYRSSDPEIAAWRASTVTSEPAWAVSGGTAHARMGRWEGTLPRGHDALEFVEEVLDHDDVIASVDLGRSAGLLHHEEPLAAGIDPVVDADIVPFQHEFFL